MRVLAAIFAVLGIAISGVVAVIAYQAMQTATQAIDRIKESPQYKLAMAIGEEQAKKDPEMRKTLDDLKKAEQLVDLTMTFLELDAEYDAAKRKSIDSPRSEGLYARAVMAASARNEARGILLAFLHKAYRRAKTGT